ncbi:hypothetical protein BZA77DRAFT_340591 [Pyronema omphalodes]|nr:hypothetical protein BZA77DRAFT_340591 [Pyronema omphalodes]
MHQNHIVGINIPLSRHRQSTSELHSRHHHIPPPAPAALTPRSKPSKAEPPMFRPHGTPQTPRTPRTPRQGMPRHDSTSPSPILIPRSSRGSFRDGHWQCRSSFFVGHCNPPRPMKFLPVQKEGPNKGRYYQAVLREPKELAAENTNISARIERQGMAAAALRRVPPTPARVPPTPSRGHNIFEPATPTTRTPGGTAGIDAVSAVDFFGPGATSVARRKLDSWTLNSPTKRPLDQSPTNSGPGIQLARIKRPMLRSTIGNKLQSSANKPKDYDPYDDFDFDDIEDPTPLPPSPTRAAKFKNIQEWVASFSKDSWSESASPAKRTKPVQSSKPSEPIEPIKPKEPTETTKPTRSESSTPIPSPIVSKSIPPLYIPPAIETFAPNLQKSSQQITYPTLPTLPSTLSSDYQDPPVDVESDSDIEDVTHLHIPSGLQASQTSAGSVIGRNNDGILGSGGSGVQKPSEASGSSKDKGALDDGLFTSPRKGKPSALFASLTGTPIGSNNSLPKPSQRIPSPPRPKTLDPNQNLSTPRKLRSACDITTPHHRTPRLPATPKTFVAYTPQSSQLPLVKEVLQFLADNRVKMSISAEMQLKDILAIHAKRYEAAVKGRQVTREVMEGYKREVEELKSKVGRLEGEKFLGFAEQGLGSFRMGSTQGGGGEGGVGEI